jgi:Zn-dependent protease
MDFLTFAAQDRALADNLIYAVQFMVILLFSLSFHEAAHAFMAYKCGDDTARLMGRMTLNPIPHIDPIGTLLMPGLMIVTSITGTGIPFLIGWAKPVPVNPLRFRDYHKGEILVSLAGPFSNFILLVGGALVCRGILIASRHFELGSGVSLVFLFFYYFASLNSVLFLFNLIPIPPLDGSHVLRIFLPARAAETYDRVIAPYGFFILILFASSPIFRWISSGAMIAMDWLISAGTTG